MSMGLTKNSRKQHSAFSVRPQKITGTAGRMWPLLRSSSSSLLSCSEEEQGSLDLRSSDWWESQWSYIYHLSCKEVLNVFCRIALLNLVNDNFFTYRDIAISCSLVATIFFLYFHVLGKNLKNVSIVKNNQNIYNFKMRVPLVWTFFRCATTKAIKVSNVGFQKCLFQKVLSVGNDICKHWNCLFVRSCSITLVFWVFYSPKSKQ